MDFFFVLSGFIITWIHWSDIGRKERIRSFAAKRFVRIFPPYWFILAPLVILYLVFTGAGQPSQRDPVNIILSILLLPNPVQPVLGVAWTLTHEIFFYALFAAIIWCEPQGIVDLASMGARYRRSKSSGDVPGDRVAGLSLLVLFSARSISNLSWASARR